MKFRPVLSVLAVLSLLVAWLQHEHTRGTFNAVERSYASWLAANTGPRPSLPPLTVVLFDEEASELGGSGRMALLDGALFTRAASRLGAVAAGVEGVAGDASRMIEAAEGMPVFGGYALDQPPGQGWTPLRGEPGADWEESPGLAGRGGRFARGFIAPPEDADGACRILLAARNAERAVPSFLALVWVAALENPWTELAASPDGLSAGKAGLPLARDGSVRYYPGHAPDAVTMNELLVVAEKFEREGGTSPFRGHLMVLGRATADVARVAVGGARALTPLERWASVWEPVRTGRLFLPPPGWYPPALVVAGALLALGPARRSARAGLLAGLFAVLTFALVALGAFGSAGILLPAVPTLSTIVVALLIGRGAPGLVRWGAEQ